MKIQGSSGVQYIGNRNPESEIRYSVLSDGIDIEINKKTILNSRKRIL